MDTRLPPLSQFALPALVTVCCFVIALFTWRAFGGDIPLEPVGYRATVSVRDASNLLPGSDVQVAGVPIGHVSSVKRRGSRAGIEMEIEARYAPLRALDRVSLRTKTLLGEGYLEITPGARRAPPVADGGQLRADLVQPRQQLDDVLSTFSPPTRRALQRTFVASPAQPGGAPKR